MRTAPDNSAWGLSSGYAHNGIQVTAFGTTLANYLGDRVADHIGEPGRGYHELRTSLAT
jgi:hypothetical protein